MLIKRHFYPILVLLLAIFITDLTYAAECVRPLGAGGCHGSIQDAIDAVAPGGTVQVYPGIYYGDFFVNKPGVNIEGMGNKRTDVRVDIRPIGSNFISGNGVTIKNLTIQNGQAGFMIHPSGSNAKIINVNIFNSMFDSIHINDANNVLINKCKILKSGENGVNNPAGAELTVRNTIISDCGTDGINCGGDQLTVDGCTIKNVGEDLIDVLGSHAAIRDNQLFGAGRMGIKACGIAPEPYAQADFITVTGNLVRRTGEAGIDICAEAPVVKNNSVMHAEYSGFWILVSEGDFKLVNNVSNYNEHGFYIVFNDASPSERLIKKNKALNNEIDGFAIDRFGIPSGADKKIMENLSKYNGAHGFDVSFGSLENNMASENGLSGYNLETFTGVAGSTTSTQNKAINNMAAGFTVGYENNLLRKNRAIGNLFHGIHVTGDNNDMINNTMLDSLFDKCDEGTGNTWTGNNYDTECP